MVNSYKHLQTKLQSIPRSKIISRDIRKVRIWEVELKTVEVKKEEPDSQTLMDTAFLQVPGSNDSMKFTEFMTKYDHNQEEISHSQGLEDQVRFLL